MGHPISHTVSVGYDSLLAVLYPQRCQVCGGSVERRELGVACEPCWNETPTFGPSDLVCWKCGRPSGVEALVERAENVRCHRCDDENFSAARACGAYHGALRASVLALKREAHISKRLKKLLVDAQQRHPLSAATRIVPVPLHPQRQKARGFNQAEIIAAALASECGLPIDTKSLVRTIYIDQHRAGMDVKDRRKSVDSAFEVVYPSLISGERILLVDDVFTTGATVSACATALFQAGAEEVFVVTIARPIH